ncbi:MAG: ion transporter [Chloroflexota bacterium]|nr:ion transporter [Chloroflexota bacterium]
MSLDRPVKAELHAERLSLLERVHDALDGVMVLLSAAWIALLVVEFAGDGLPATLDIAVWLIWGIFIIDFVVEFSIAPVKGHYLRTHWLTAVSLVLPAFRILRLASFLRALRAARIVRGIGMLRLLTSINRGLASLSATAARRGVGYAAAATALIMVVGSAGMAYFESTAALTSAGAPDADTRALSDYGEAFWWTAYTMTTGAPREPFTGEGRLLGWLLSLVGLAIFGYLTAALASHFIDRDRGQVAADAGAGQERTNPTAFSPRSRTRHVARASVRRARPRA